MIEDRSVPVRIPSKGWREVSFLRLGLAGVTAFLVADVISLFGWPWSNSFVVYVLAIEAVVILAGVVMIESLRPRWISCSDNEVTIGYLFGPITIPWDRLSASSIRPPLRYKVVAYADTGIRGLRGRRLHWVTLEQSGAMSPHIDRLGQSTH